MGDLDKLKRMSAGEYRTADERFTVRSDGGRWFLVDSERTDELGQPLVRGPYPSRSDAAAAVPVARAAKDEPMAVPKPSAKGRPKRAAEPAAKRKPETWIDRLPPQEAARVRGLIRALEKLGVADAEALVRRDRDGLAPAIVQRLIERELANIVEQQPARERAAAARLVKRAAAIVAGQVRHAAGLPGWRVVETGPEPDPPNRRVTLPD